MSASGPLNINRNEVISIKHTTSGVDLDKLSLDITKDILIAKLQKSSPTTTSADIGKAIGETFKALHAEIDAVVKSTAQPKE